MLSWLAPHQCARLAASLQHSSLCIVNDGSMCQLSGPPLLATTQPATHVHLRISGGTCQPVCTARRRVISPPPHTHTYNGPELSADGAACARLPWVHRVQWGAATGHDRGPVGALGQARWPVPGAAAHRDGCRAAA